MKLHLPTRLRAAVIAAMAFLATAPAAFAMDIDPSTAVYDALLMGSSDSITIPPTVEPKDNYYDNQLTLPTGLEYLDSWSMVIQADGWTTINDQLIFGWNDATVMFAASKQNWLTYSDLHHGFALMMTSGRLIMMTSDSYTSFNGKVSDYKENGILLADLGKQKDVDVELTITYNRPLGTLTVQSGTLKFGETTREIETHTYQNIDLYDTNPLTYYTHIGGSDLNVGATTTVTVIIPGDENAWNLSGLTSLEGLQNGDYNDVVSGESPEGRPLQAEDGIYFVGGNGVLYTESDQTIDNTLGTALMRETPTIPSSIGLGAAEGTKLTITQGATALGQGSGLRIVGDGEVELQAGAAETTSTKLSLADASTLTVKGANAHTFEVTGSSISSNASLAAENGLNLRIADGSAVQMKGISVDSGNTYLYGKGSYDVQNLTIGGTTACIGFLPNEDAVVVKAAHAAVSADNFNIMAGNALQIDTAEFTGMNVSVMDKMTVNDLTSDAIVASMNPSNWSYQVSLDKLTDDAFTATKLTMDANTGKAAATSLSKAVATVSAGSALSVTSATDTTFKSKSSTLAATSVTGSLSMSLDNAAVATIKAGAMELNSSTLKGKDKATINRVTINSGATLTMKESAALTAKDISGNALTMQGETLILTDTADVDTIKLSGPAVLSASQTLTVKELTMSDDSLVVARTLDVSSGTINIPTTTFLLQDPSTTTLSKTVVSDAQFGTKQGYVSDITGGEGSSVSVGTGYTLTGVKSTPAMVDVEQLNLADNATLRNIELGHNTATHADGTQNLDGVVLSGGYDGLSFNGGATSYLTVSDSLPYGSTLDSVALTGTADAATLNLEHITVNGQGLFFDSGTGWTNSYTLLTTDDGVTLNFDADIDNIQFNITPYTYAELRVEQEGDAEKLVIYGREAKEEVMTSLRSTSNRAAAMTALAAAAESGATGALLAVYNYLGDVYHPTETQRRNTLSAAAGASLANIADAQRRGIEDVQKSLRNRIVQMGGANEGLVRGWESADIQAWAQADGAYHTLSQSGDLSGYDYDIWGATVGANLDVTEHFTAGLSLSVEHGTISGKGEDKLDADTDSIYVNFFGRYQKGHWTHLGIFTVGFDETDTTRRVLNYQGTGSTSGTSFSGYYELGYLIPLDEEVHQLIQPIFNVSLTSAKTNGFSEKGSIGTAGLNYESQNLIYGSVGLGARYQAVLAQSVYERNTVLELRGQFNQHFGDSTDEASLSFIGGGTPYTVHGAESGAFGVQLGAGLAVPVSTQTTIFGDVDAEFRTKQTDVRANIGVRYDF